MKDAKKLLIAISFILFGGAGLAQAPPHAFTYSAIAKGHHGHMLANKIISLRFSIIEGNTMGNIVYQETTIDTTNPKGMFVTAIGNGTPIQGSIAGINWGGNKFYLKVELDEKGGTSYVDVGTTQLLSVPYALYAGHAGIADSAMVGAPGPTGPIGPPGPVGATGATGATGYYDGSGESGNPLYPDGLDSITPVNTLVVLGSPYVVPAGQNFYGSIACRGSRVNTVSISGNAVYGGVAQNAILGAGTEVAHAGSNIVSINGFTVPAQVTPVILNNASLPYTVPAGQTFYLTCVYPDVGFGTELTINGAQTNKCYPPNCTPSLKFYLLGAGDVLGGTFGSSDLILGYLK